MRGLQRVFDIRSGEGLPILFLLAFSLCAGVFTALYFTAANAAFLGHFEIRYLPYAYIVSALVGGLVTGGFSLLGRRARFTTLVVGSLVAVFLLVGLLWSGLRFSQAGWVSFLLFIWIDPLFTIVDLGFWGLGGRLFDLQQAKRLFGLISSGEVVSAILGFFAVPLLLRWGTVSLLVLVAAVGVGCCAVIALLLGRRFLLAGEPAPTAAAADGGGGRTAAGRYVGLICAVVVVVVVTLYFVDFSLLTNVRQRFGDAEAMGGFLALFWGATRSAELLAKTLLSGRLIGQFGLLFGLLSLPGSVLVLAALTALTGGVVGTAGALFFVLVAVTRLVEFVARRALFDPSFKILFQPLDEHLRFAVQTRVDGIVRQLGLLVAGVALAAIAEFPAVGLGSVMTVTAFVALGGGATTALMFKEYRGKLREALSKRTGGSLRESPIDLIRRTLRQVGPVQSLYGFDILLRVDPGLTEQLLREKLASADAARRLEAVACIQRHLTVTLRPDVESLAAGDPDSQVRRQALAATAVLATVERIAESPQRIADLASSPDRHDRLRAALALARSGESAPPRPLRDLLQDRDAQIRRISLVAAGRTGSSEHWPRLIDHLPAGLFCQSAIAGLLANGEAVLPALELAFSRFGDQPDTLRRILRIYERLGSAEAKRLLFALIDHPHRDVQHQALLSLSTCGFQAADFQVPLVHSKIEGLIGRIAWHTAARRDLGTRPDFAVLAESLAEQLRRERTMLFYLLGMICEPEVVRMMQASFESAVRGGEVYALEIASEVTPPELHPILFPVLEQVAAGPMLDRLSLHFPQRTLSATERLRDIIRQGYDRVNPWTRASAISCLADAGESAIPDELVANLFHPNLMIRELVAATMERIDRVGWERHLVRLPEAEATHLAEVTRDRARRRLRVFEKVELLRRSRVFAPIPTPILARLALELGETRLAQGAPIFEQGETGQTMYVVAEGRIRISQNGAVINYVGENEVLGEIAVLTTDVRSASARAETATRLIEIDQDRILSLLADHLEVLPDLLEIIIGRLANEPAAA